MQAQSMKAIALFWDYLNAIPDIVRLLSVNKKDRHESGLYE